MLLRQLLSDPPRTPSSHHRAASVIPDKKKASQLPLQLRSVLSELNKAMRLMVSPSDSDSQPLKLAILANVNVIHKKARRSSSYVKFQQSPNAS